MKVELKARQGIDNNPFYYVSVNGQIEYGSYCYESVARFYNDIVHEKDAIPLF